MVTCPLALQTSCPLCSHSWCSGNVLRGTSRWAVGTWTSATDARPGEQNTQVFWRHHGSPGSRPACALYWQAICWVVAGFRGQFVVAALPFGARCQGFLPSWLVRIGGLSAGLKRPCSLHSRWPGSDITQHDSVRGPFGIGANTGIPLST
jgi:hypothetical protein